MRTALALACLAGCGGWSNRDTLGEVAFGAATAVDGAESVEIGRECHEENPLIGSCGQHLNTYIPTSVAVHYAISLMLPAGPWRRGWQMLTLGAEASTAVGNYALGYKP